MRRFDFLTALVLAVAASFAVCDSAAAQGTRYRLTKIADSSQVPSLAAAGCLGINDLGTVVFATSDGALWRGNGTTLTRLAEPGPTGSPLTSPCPGLNDADDVVYGFAFTSGPYTALLKQSGNVVTELARSDSGPYQYATAGTSIHSLTNAGDTVMAGTDGVLYILPAGIPVYTQGPSDPALSSVVSGTMSNSNGVAFNAIRQTPDGPKRGIYLGSGSPLVEDGNAVVALVAPAPPVTNNSGIVAFLGRLADGRTHVLSTSDGVSFIDHSGSIASEVFPSFSIADDGTVVFAATLTDGNAGLFTGGDVLNDKVIAPGDSLDGSTVVTTALSHESINAGRQIAMRVELADGRTAIYRAEPVVPPVAQNGTLNLSSNTTAAGTLVASDPANLPLTYAIVTNGTRGLASITDAATGAYTYTPSLNAIGTDTLTFQASNGTLASNVATVTVAIAAGAGGNSPPVAFTGGSVPAASVRFDSVADELSSVVNLPSPTSFTMMGWFRIVGDAGVYSAFLRLGSNGSTSHGYNMLTCCGNGSYKLGIWTGTGLQQTSSSLTAGTWYHLALTVEGSGPGQVKVYKDGALALTTAGNPIVTSQRLSIGNDAHLEWLNGNAVTIKIYDVPLSREEIAREMTQFAPVRTANLNSWYPLQTSESAATDFSGNERHLKMTGPITTDIDGPGILAGVTRENTPLSGVLPASDPDANPLTYRVVTNGTKGAVTTDTATGTYVYTPNPDETGTDVFTFKANDGLLDSNVASMPIVVLPATFPLTVTVAGAGTGTVKLTPPAITCATGCTESFQRGTTVLLTATPAAGSAFTGWGGACTGTGTCSVTIDDDTAVTATFIIASRDLVTTAVTDPPMLAAPGSTFAATVTTQNRGTVSVIATTTRFYLSQDAAKSADDLLLAATLAVPALNSDASATGTVTLTVPTTTPLGAYRLIACADDRAVVAEGAEGNNCLPAAGAIDVQRPDLVEGALTNPPQNIAPGVSFSVTDTVENRGRTIAAASTTRYYLSADATKSPDDITIVVTRAVPALAAGASSTGTKTVVVPATTPLGTYTLIACADDPKTVIELDETNNCLASTATVLVARPDLVEASVSASVTAALPGGTLTITDTVENRGMAPAGASTTRYYLSPDGQKSTAVMLSGTRSVAALPASGTSTGSKAVTVPASIPLGAYYVLVCADDLAVVTEVADNNNCLASAATVLIGWPDLVTSNIGNPPVEIAPAKSFSIASAVLNQGDVTAAATTTRYYLSLDGLRSGEDLLLTGTRVVLSLAPGVTSTGTLTVTVPATVPAATYFVLACADDLVKVAEGPNEANNCSASGTPVSVRLPDLAQATINNPPVTITAGGTLSVSDSVTNQGTIGAGSTTTQYYLSVDGQKNGATLLGGVRSVSALAAGASNSGTRVVTIPLTMPVGSYYVLACADDTKTAIESNEGNNCLASSSTTTIQ